MIIQLSEIKLEGYVTFFENYREIHKITLEKDVVSKITLYHVDGSTSIYHTNQFVAKQK